MKEREQVDLTKTVIEKVLANLKDEKTQRDILVSAIVEVERELFAICCPSIPHLLTSGFIELVTTKAV